MQKSVFSMDVSLLPPLPFQVKRPLEEPRLKFINQDLRPRPAFDRNTFRRLSSYSNESCEKDNQAMTAMEETLSRIKSSDSSTPLASMMNCSDDCKMSHPKAA
jgi:hypothetical protein